jgi:hypothetical protein
MPMRSVSSVSDTFNDFSTKVKNQIESNKNYIQSSVSRNSSGNSGKGLSWSDPFRLFFSMTALVTAGLNFAVTYLGVQAGEVLGRQKKRNASGGVEPKLVSNGIFKGLSGLTGGIFSVIYKGTIGDPLQRLGNTFISSNIGADRNTYEDDLRTSQSPHDDKRVYGSPAEQSSEWRKKIINERKKADEIEATL